MLSKIYKPYFYIIQEITTGIYYAGSKRGKDASPHTFLIDGGYLTSSTIIRSIIKKNGIVSFKIRKIKLFDKPIDAYIYETKFLKKVNAKCNPKFYNRHNNDHIFSYHDDAYKIKMIEVYGVDNPNYSKEIVNRIKQTNIQKLGVPYPMMNNEIKEKSKQSSLKKYGTENAMQSDKIKNKHQHTIMKIYGVKNVFQSEEVKEKIQQSLMKKYNVDNPTRSEQVKHKIRSTNTQRYGVENVFLCDNIKSKIKERVEYLLKRPQVDILRKYQKFTK